MTFTLSSDPHPTKPYEPTPRFEHCATSVGGKCYLWGGRIPDYAVSDLTSNVEVFDPNLEAWEKCPTTGVPPLGLYNAACATLLDSVYWFGGFDGTSYYNSLHRLDPTTLEWRELQPLNQADGPIRKTGCGMVPFLHYHLAVFGGHGISTGGARKWWSDKLHVFNITESKWSSPSTTGPRPPTCAYFSFTAINSHQAVLFGGKHISGKVNDCYLMDFESMKWTKLERPEGAPWPVERTDHAACCLNYGEEHPQLLVTGGIGRKDCTLQDAWILDVKFEKWRELENTQPRMLHTATALSLGPGRTQVIMFGGCPQWEKNKSPDAQQKLANVTLLEFESVESPMSADRPSNKEWNLSLCLYS